MSATGAGAADIGANLAAFAIALIALCAKMAKADGRVTRTEINVFKRLFRVPEAEAAQVGRIFDEARRETTGFEPYAQQIAQLFAHNPEVREELLGALFRIATADGHMHEKEHSFLRRVAEIFGFDELAFERILASHMGPSDNDPYEILGLSRDAPHHEIKAAYRALIRENHPDRLVAQGMPEEMVVVANDKMAAINDAYDRVARLRGIN
jgi:DnaJ like chaperone protein